MYEFIGIIASLFVLISFLFKSVKKIRTFNIIGAAVFVIYGILINALSVWILNGILIFVHLFYLNKLK